ncbi:MAG: prepilin-type N-terminal cleavage/methylation domain-containing protein [Chloroflexi bacterium]|nr:prepilin-type N-terminal cleavage/methylation domain-containing protein [Chloroflexota bacterium]
MRHPEKAPPLGGFTLIELVAVMAIMAVLVAVVAPAVTGTRNASVRAQAQADAKQVRAAVNAFFGRQEGGDVRTPHTVQTAAKLPTVAGVRPGPPEHAQGGGPPTHAPGQVKAKQVLGSRWPELFITLQVEADTRNGDTVPEAPGQIKKLGAEYPHVFTTGSADNVAEVVLLDSQGTTIAGTDLLEQFTAIDMDTLLEGGFLQAKPSGIRQDSNGFPTFLWLFRKTTSSMGLQGDEREVAVFVLVGVKELENQPATKKIGKGAELEEPRGKGRAKSRAAVLETIAENKVRLIYQQIVGSEG